MNKRHLSQRHKSALIEGSAISELILEEMGVWTAERKSELNELGFKQSEIQPPAMVLPIFTRSDGGTPSYSRIRPDSPRTDAKGKPRKYEQPPGKQCRPYCLPTARRLIEGLQGAKDGPQASLPYLFITEGEKKAAALVSQGLAALGLPGVWNFKSPEAVKGDWEQIGLKGLQVCILFDSDAATNEHVRKAEDSLAEMLKVMGATVFICRLPAGPNGEKTGADDFFVQGGSFDDLANLIENHISAEPASKQSPADCLIELAKGRAVFWREKTGQPFATVPLASGGSDNLPLSDPRFREWLDQESWKTKRQISRREAMDRAIESLAAQARFEGETRPTAIRVGHADEAVWLDLCDPTRSIVKVTGEGWSLVADCDCPVRFMRPKQMCALPDPKRGGTMDTLRELLCVDADGFRAIQAFAQGTFMPPPGGFPILVATGEQGSGKSFGCKALRALLDPSDLQLRGAPKDENNLCAALSSNYLLGFDNLSKLPGWLSDGLCSLATGGGIAKRRLFTDGDEFIVTGRRPVVINGINDVVSAPDLAERCLFVEFTRPDDSSRRTEADLEALLEQNGGLILGAMLDNVSRALRDRKTISLPGSLPRLADFAVWVYAGTPESERSDMWRVLGTNRHVKNLATIEDDVLASAVRSLALAGGFTGTPQELLGRLNSQEGISVSRDRPEGWPASPTALGKRLKRLSTVLRAVGVDLRSDRTAKWRTWTVAMKEQLHVSQASHVSLDRSHEPKNGSLDCDASDDTCGKGSSDLSFPAEFLLNSGELVNDVSDADDASCPSLAKEHPRKKVVL